MSKLIYLALSVPLYLLSAVNDDLTGISTGILVVFWIILLALGIFWWWMLIDCAKRDFEAKGKWITILILLNVIGAIAYFVMVKRKASRTASPAVPQP